MDKRTFKRQMKKIKKLIAREDTIYTCNVISCCSAFLGMRYTTYIEDWNEGQVLSFSKLGYQWVGLDDDLTKLRRYLAVESFEQEMLATGEYKKV